MTKKMSYESMRTVIKDMRSTKRLLLAARCPEARAPDTAQPYHFRRVEIGGGPLDAARDTVTHPFYFCDVVLDDLYVMFVTAATVGGPVRVAYGRPANRNDLLIHFFMCPSYEPPGGVLLKMAPPGLNVAQAARAFMDRMLDRDGTRVDELVVTVPIESIPDYRNVRVTKLRYDLEKWRVEPDEDVVPNLNNHMLQTAELVELINVPFTIPSLRVLRCRSLHIDSCFSDSYGLVAFIGELVEHPRPLGFRLRLQMLTSEDLWMFLGNIDHLGNFGVEANGEMTTLREVWQKCFIPVRYCSRRKLAMRCFEPVGIPIEVVDADETF